MLKRTCAFALMQVAIATAQIVVGDRVDALNSESAPSSDCDSRLPCIAPVAAVPPRMPIPGRGSDPAPAPRDDCNNNGIPDEDELYGLEYLYLWDDGGAEYGLRSANPGGQTAWLNQFHVEGGNGIITAIRVYFVNIPVDRTADVYLWSDPNGDGNPLDATVLASATVTSETFTFITVDIPDTYVGPNGASFFVGAIMSIQTTNDFPAPLDATPPSYLGRSWTIGNAGTIDPNDLGAGALEVALLENAIPFPANFLLRAVGVAPTGDCNLNSIPDDCDIAAGTSLDLDGNGVPDECEDCNTNGIPDGVDIANGTSLDCQPDGVPDECQVAQDDCNADGIPDDCQLSGNDCNQNGRLDSCDISLGSSEDNNGDGIPDECQDCNGNGVIDAYDVDPADPDGNGQVSADCQPDGVPDECQQGEPDYYTYLVDDGTFDASLGLGAPGDTAWLNHFTVVRGHETLAYVDLVYSPSMPIGQTVQVYVWRDPNGDADPGDAQVIANTSATITTPGSNTYNAVAIGPVALGSPGTSFFVGAFFSDPTGSVFPIPRDQTDVRGESWFAAQTSPGTLDPNNLGAAEYFGRLTSSFFPGNVMVRARGYSGVFPNDCNDNGIPDECDLADGTLVDRDQNGIPDSCEDCNGNGIPDGCDVSCDGPCAAIQGCGQETDCDGNGIPDSCDIANGADCNGNGFPDACDVPPLGNLPDCNADGIPDSCQLTGNDCNTDGIPDDCQLGGPSVPQYFVDDGSAENSVGLVSGGSLVWLNHFVVQPNGTAVRGARIRFGNVPLGTPVDIYVWSDPNGDGDPRDAAVLQSLNATVPLPEPDGLARFTFADTPVGPAGTSFFVGLRVQHGVGVTPAPIDLSSDRGQSWIAAGSTQVDPNNLSGAALFGNVQQFGYRGNWLVRALAAADPPPNDCNSNGIPDECDLASGASEDCNGNGIPDECDVPPIGDYAADCNGNLIPDECELRPDRDCDGNGVLDECQPEDDCDGNGLLDSCEPQYAEGLVGHYWRSVGGAGNFSRPLAVRVDPQVNFDWAGGLPHPDVPADDFAVRWSGMLATPAESGVYTLFVRVDDGVRLWIGGRLLIDEWHPSSGLEYSATIALLGDSTYPIRVDYYEGGGDARISLQWSVPGRPKVAIPSSALRPMQDCNGNLVPDPCDVGGSSADVDGDGIPDECQDCNSNGVPDSIDIANGTVSDCNDNGLIDSCETASGGLADCDGNGIPDSCEPQADCDNNGVNDACQAIYLGLVGRYYAGPAFNTLVAARIDPQVDFDFAGGAPLPGMPTNDFTIRWSGALHTTPVEGDYTIAVVHDDGARVLLDGVPIIDHFSGSGTDSVTVSLAADTAYPLRVEYREASGDARISLQWQPPGGTLTPIPPSALQPMLDDDGDGVPDTCQLGDCNANDVPDDRDIAAGRSLDCDTNGVPDECQACEDCDQNGLLDRCENTNTLGLTGQYFRSLNGAGQFSDRVAVRIDPNVEFDWGGNGPFPGLADEFSVRWTGVVVTTEVGGLYSFFTFTDDGARLWVDEQLIINYWQPQSATERSGSISLAPNRRYRIRMEYREDGGGAVAELRWQPPGSLKTVIPTEALRAMSDADGDGVPDSCDADCNGNGLPDVGELLNGTAQDCNGNCVPDECDLVMPPPDYGQAYWRFENISGTTIPDSGPNNLDGTTNGRPLGSIDVPHSQVPQNAFSNTGSLDLQWASTSSGGFFDVPDTGSVFSFGDTDFTLEAWVKLNALSSTSGPDQRQYLCQKKVLPSADSQLDYAVLVQRGDNNGAPNYGKNSSFSGRELQVVFGSGSAIWTVTSFLQIQNTNWNYVCVTHDSTANTIRFTLNGQSETIAFTQQPRVINTGPLRVGGHQNSSGVNNFFVRGSIDEMRVSRGILPLSALLRSLVTPFSSDVNSNGVPDECEDCNGNGIFDDQDIATGTSQDCNGNDTPDECDIADGTSADVNGDGIPDECAPPCPGDLNGSGDVDIQDLALLLSHFGTVGGVEYGDGDIDNDDDVDLQDLAQLLSVFGSVCP